MELSLSLMILSVFSVSCLQLWQRTAATREGDGARYANALPAHIFEEEQYVVRNVWSAVSIAVVLQFLAIVLVCGIGISSLFVVAIAVIVFLHILIIIILFFILFRVCLLTAVFDE